MKGGAAFRGQPLLLLGGLLMCWTALRTMLWEPPLAEHASRIRQAKAGPVLADSRAADPAGVQESLAWLPPSGPANIKPIRATAPNPRTTPFGRLIARSALPQPTAVRTPETFEYKSSSPGVPAAAPAIARKFRAPIAQPARWSADGWLLLRNDTVTPFVSGRPSYGRSQAGAILRYDIALTSSHRPQAYVRGSTALAGEREQEIAAGLSVRPVAGLPVRMAIEGRVGETNHGARARPAVYAVTELAPFRLPAAMRAEIYAQAGYVGGAFATAFVDGQVYLDRSLARRGGIEVSAGTGAWGGAQDDASRLDIGPTATVSFRLGKGFGRIAAD